MVPLAGVHAASPRLPPPSVLPATPQMPSPTDDSPPLPPCLLPSRPPRRKTHVDWTSVDDRGRGTDDRGRGTDDRGRGTDDGGRGADDGGRWWTRKGNDGHSRRDFVSCNVNLLIYSSFSIFENLSLGN
ncbi:hypothetical protein KC19_3G051300 [Ceratodon purpureus]|uniref:Uncharacterized protein n=1 Tax=Ceratodon purpureus TaxID=3225 RepID=A0A8T0IHM9_CERPU|nr:hypothetical protein KC19_3G051300 [Ceratodon purpureus]